MDAFRELGKGRGEHEQTARSKVAPRKRVNCTFESRAAKASELRFRKAPRKRVNCNFENSTKQTKQIQFLKTSQR